MTLSGDKVPGHGADYPCLVASHSYTSDNYGSGGSAGDGYAYSGRYTLMPATAPMLPEQKTPRADVQGPQTAVVVGTGEIDCDEYGRILVRFHWDLDAAFSMRCRVSQNWGGAGWGGIVIPRIGMEVIVEFLDGDPDKPIITGCVYNGKNSVPYKLPDHKTRSTFKSQTHQGTGFNELRFEDNNGEEEIYIHAQKDRNEKTLNNHTERIDNNFVQSVGHNKVVEIQNNQNEVIGGDLYLSVGPSAIGTLVNKLAATALEGVKSLTSGLGLLGKIIPGKGNMSVFVDKAKVETVGFTSLETIGTKKSIVAGIDSSTSAGKHTHMSTGQKFTIVAGDEFEIVCGDSRFVMLSDGTVKILGNNFYFASYDDFVIRAKDVKIN